ncbi:MAG: LacI family transcriptional regulator [Bacillota bacterium]|nr:LacI family transcriptional regulator [Bacillota bacterium]
MSTTIKDVAKEAGVSPSTVSRVLGNSPRISDETKARVMEAAKKLNYHPNVIARSLAVNSSKILGLVLPDTAEDLFHNPFYIQVMAGISIYAQKKGYNIMYSFGKNEKDEVNIIKDYTDSKLVDGIILLVSKTKDKCIELLKKRNYPFVVIGRPEKADDVLWVDNDNFGAMYQVTDSVIDKGYKNIAYIGGPSDWNVSNDRLEGFLKSLQVHGIDCNKNIIIENNEFNEELGYSAMNKILDFIKPDAVLTCDDQLAFGAIRAIRERKQDGIFLVGFNNTPLSEYQDPPLSSVDINSDKLGYSAAKLLISCLENENDVSHYIIETKLVERNKK